MISIKNNSSTEVTMPSEQPLLQLPLKKTTQVRNLSARSAYSTQQDTTPSQNGSSVAAFSNAFYDDGQSVGSESLNGSDSNSDISPKTKEPLPPLVTRKPVEPVAAKGFDKQYW